MNLDERDTVIFLRFFGFMLSLAGLTYCKILDLNVKFLTVKDRKQK